MNLTQQKADFIASYNQQSEQQNNSEIASWKAKERAYFLSLLQKERARTLLEIGAGHGRDSLFFQEQGLKVTAIDLSPAMVALCQQ